MGLQLALANPQQQGAALRVIGAGILIVVEQLDQQALAAFIVNLLCGIELAFAHQHTIISKAEALDRVVAATEYIGVATIAADQQIIATTAQQAIGTITTPQGVVPIAAIEGVVAIATAHLIVA